MSGSALLLPGVNGNTVSPPASDHSANQSCGSGYFGRIRNFEEEKKLDPGVSASSVMKSVLVRTQIQNQFCLELKMRNTNSKISTLTEREKLILSDLESGVFF